MKSSPVTTLLVVLAVAGVGLGSWSLLGSSGDAPNLATTADDDAPAPPRFELDPTVITFDGESTDAWNDEELDAPDRREVTAEPSEAATGPALRVRVIDGPGGVPVPKAEVFWAAFDGDRARVRFGDLPVVGRRWGGGSRHVAAGLLADGDRRITDDAGETTLPPNPWRIAVAARTPGRIGFGEIERGRGEELVVVLVPDESVVVKVVGRTGEPQAGAPVVILQGGDNDRTEAIWISETDAKGTARLEHFRLHVRDNRPSRFAAALRMPLVQPELREFAGDPVPNQPVVLTMPAAGFVEVTVLDRTRQPIESAMRLWLSIHRANKPQTGFALPNWFEMAMVTKERGASTARFGPIGLDLQLVAGATFRDGDRGRGRDGRFGGEVFAGPRAAGQVVETVLMAPEWLALLRGRVLAPDGTPRAMERVPAQVRDAARVWTNTTLQTDEAGRFEQPLRLTNEVVQPATMELVERIDGATRAALLAQLPTLAPGSRVELGDLRLVAIPPIARGHVIDERGAPITDARVQLQVAADGQRFADAGLARDRTGEDGNFVLYGLPPTGTLRIRASADRHITGAAPLLSNGAVVDIVLLRSVDLRLIIRLPEGVPDQGLTAELRAADGGKRNLDLRRRGEIATWGANDLPRGTYDLAVQVRNFPGDLRVVRGIALDPDGDPAQRRIEIDLRGALFNYDLQLIGATGEPDARARGVLLARTLQPDGSLDWRAFQLQRGHAQFVSTMASIEAIAIVEGRSEVSTWLRPGESRLRSYPIHPVEVSLPGLRGLIGEGQVRVSLVLLADTGLPSGISAVDQRNGRSSNLQRASLGKSGGAWLGADDNVSIPVTRNGRYQVVVRIHPGGRSRVESRVMAEIDVVVDGPSPTRLSVPPDTDKLREALAAIARRG